MAGWANGQLVEAMRPVQQTLQLTKQTTDFGEGLWAGIYNNLEDYQYVETNRRNWLPNRRLKHKLFYQGARKIIRSHEFQQLVDMFGNVPYHGAFQGTGNLQPVYDDAQAIYEDLIVQIDSGINLYQSSPVAGIPQEVILCLTAMLLHGCSLQTALKLEDTDSSN